MGVVERKLKKLRRVGSGWVFKLYPQQGIKFTRCFWSSNTVPVSSTVPFSL